jgi:hypothetical protein
MVLDLTPLRKALAALEKSLGFLNSDLDDFRRDVAGLLAELERRNRGTD